MRKSEEIRMSDENFVGRMTTFILENTKMHSGLTSEKRIKLVKRHIVQGTPFGKRWAHNSVGLPLDSLDGQPEFTFDNEIEFEEAANDCKWDVAKISEAKYIFFMNWNDINRNKAARVFESASTNETSDYYSNFSTRRAANKNAAAKFTEICSLASSSASYVLGLMHERTGHLNKRALIECVKLKLVTSLKIADSDIRRYRKSDKDVCDICARAKLTRTAFSKIHAIREKSLEIISQWTLQYLLTVRRAKDSSMWHVLLTTRRNSVGFMR